MSSKLNIVDAGPETNADILKIFPTEKDGYVRVGDAGYLFPTRCRDGLQQIYNFKLRPSDSIVASFPRSGTTWTQELVWLILNKFDIGKAKSIALTDRYAFIEFGFYQPLSLIQEINETAVNEVQRIKLLKELELTCLEDLESVSTPRFIKTHLPLTMLPPKTLETAKVVYIARDPRDVAVSFFHLNKLMVKISGFDGNFTDFWNLFIQDKIMWSPFFAHIKEAWSKRHDPNLLFLFYEDLIKDLPSAVRRVSQFFGKQCTDGDMEKLLDHLKFDNFSKNKSVTFTAMENNNILKGGEKFVRKGKSGGWREYFDYDMQLQAERWIAANLNDTDLRFPDCL